MIPLRIALLTVWSCIAFGVNAQVTAQAYFDQASKEFVKVDKMHALRTLDEALRQYPSDPKLLKLAEELVKEDEQKDKQKQDQQKKDEEQQKKDQEQEKKDQEQQQQKEEEKKEQEKKQGDKEEQAERGDENKNDQEPKPGTIAPQDAMRMLDALEGSEKNVQEKVRARLRPATRRTIEKDW